MSDIKITKRGNIKINGVKYKAKAANSGCIGCAMRGMNCERFPCVPDERPAGFKLPDQDVIFVKVAA